MALWEVNTRGRFCKLRAGGEAGGPPPPGRADRLRLHRGPPVYHDMTWCDMLQYYIMIHIHYVYTYIYIYICICIYTYTHTYVICYDMICFHLLLYDITCGKLWVPGAGPCERTNDLSQSKGVPKKGAPAIAASDQRFTGKENGNRKGGSNHEIVVQSPLSHL